MASYWVEMTVVHLVGMKAETWVDTMVMTMAERTVLTKVVSSEMTKVVLKVVLLEMMKVVMTVEQMVDPMEKLVHLKAVMMVE